MINKINKYKIQKFISNSGFCSRRQAEKYILMNEVTINDNNANIGDYVDCDKDIVKIFNKKINLINEYNYIMLYKPIGYITSMYDPYHQKNISLLIDKNYKRLLPVGRLDINSEGLLIMTNDYELIHKLTHPKYNIIKTYEAWIKKDEDINIIKNNIYDLEKINYIENIKINKCKVLINEILNDYIIISISITQGINRQIRKMCNICNLKIIKLKRVSIGEIVLDKHLSPYKWRIFSNNEILYLKTLKNNMEN